MKKIMIAASTALGTFVFSTLVFGTLFSCKAKIEYEEVEVDPKMPVLSTLAVKVNSDYKQLKTVNNLNVEFTPDMFCYQVDLSGADPAAVISLEAGIAPDKGFIFEDPQDYVTGKTLPVLQAEFSAITVHDTEGRLSTYLISYQNAPQPAASASGTEEVSGYAKLSGVSFSVKTEWNFSPDVTQYTNITVPYGTQHFTVVPAADNEINPYFAYCPDVDITGGSAAVEIVVAAQGKHINTYTLTFITGTAATSTLAGLSFSVGAFCDAEGNLNNGTGTPVIFDSTNYETQYIAVPLSVAETAVYAAPHKFSDLVYINYTSPSCAASCIGKINISTQSTNQFNIRVYQGEGYIAKDYHFSIIRVNKEQTQAGSLSVSTPSGRLAPLSKAQDIAGHPDTKPAEPYDTFSGDWALYNAHFLNVNEMTFEVNLNYSGGKADSWDFLFSGKGGAERLSDTALKINKVSASGPPLVITVYEASKLPRSYIVYFVNDGPSDAFLQSVNLSYGASLSPSPFMGESIFNYSVTVTETAAAFILDAVPANADFALSYMLNGSAASGASLDAISIGGTDVIGITVDGGGDYIAHTYIFNVSRSIYISPELDGIYVNNSANLYSYGEAYYSVEVPYSNTGRVVPVSWTRGGGSDDTGIASIRYNIDGGAYSSDAVSWSVASGVSVSLNVPALVMLRVCTVNSKQVVYTLYISMQDAPPFYVSDAGSDETGDGFSSLTAFRTLRRAAEAAQDAGTNRIMVSGTLHSAESGPDGWTDDYNAFLLNNIGTNDAPLVISGEYGTSVLTALPAGGGAATKRVVGVKGTSNLVFKDIVISDGSGTSGEGAGIAVLHAGALVTLSAGAKVTGNGKVSNAENGGGVVVHGGTLVIEEGAEIYDNAATYGGGIYNFTSNDSTYGTGVGLVQMRGGAIYNHNSSRGGGIFARGRVEMSGGRIYKCSSTDGGGGVEVAGSGEFFMSGDAIIGSEDPAEGNNGGQQGGGGVRLTNSVKFEMRGGKIKNNKSTTGGGVYIDQSGTFNMYAGSIENNKYISSAGCTGAGVIASGNVSNKPVFNMYGGTISGNDAGSNSNARGGGVRIQSNATFNMYGGTISGNYGCLNGGGVASQSARFFMTGGTISGNYANKGSGGGVSISSSLESTITGGTISGNSAKDNGGGVMIYDSVVNFAGGAISGNTASAGGGVHLSACTLNMTSGTIASNIASAAGGGVFCAGTFVFSGGGIKGNSNSTTLTGEGYGGGGVYLSDNARFTMSGAARIEANTAFEGGGLCAYNSASGTCVLNGGAITDDNEAARLDDDSVHYGNRLFKGGGGVVVTGSAIEAVLGSAVPQIGEGENVGNLWCAWN